MQRILVTILFLVVSLTSASCGPQTLKSFNQSEEKSITGAEYAGRKYYLGWGEYLSGFMGNETRYDVKHTNDIFADKIGGNYQATTLVDRQFDGSDVRNEMTKLNSEMSGSDMYVQYSSGHGYQKGLGIGISYSDIVKNALDMPAKEVVIFIMACYSGGLVDEFNARKAEWSQWQTQGRTLFVMSSSTGREESATGPGKDSSQVGPSGSAGSAYGHALWKSLSGDADGFLDGVKDGFISLGEISAYASWKTQRIGGHSPQVTGVFNPYLIMNKVPSAGYIKGLTGGTTNLSEESLRQAVARSDASMLKAEEQRLAGYTTP